MYDESKIKDLKSSGSSCCNKRDLNYPRIVDTDTIRWYLASEPPTSEKGMCSHEYVLVIGDDECQYTLRAFAQYDEEKKEWKIVNNLGVHSDVGFFPFKSEDVKYWCYLPVTDLE